MENINNGYEISLEKIIDVFKQFFVWIILSVILFGAVAAIFTELFIDDTYSTSVSFYVKDSESSSTTTTQQYSAADTHVYSILIARWQSIVTGSVKVRYPSSVKNDT